MIDKEKNEEQILTEPQLNAGRTKPGQTESDLHEGENSEQLSSRGISMDLSNEWFTSGSNDIYVADYTGPKPEIDQSKEYTFSDLVDIELLQKLFTSYYMITKIPNAILDADSNILSGLGWQDICTKFHRVCPGTLQRCLQSDSYISAHLHEGPYVGYKCLNGLIDYATPIVIEGRHLATIFTGQFFHEPPDEEFFRQQAQEYGFDEEVYLEALRKVPIIPKDKIEYVMGYFSNLGQFLAILGLERKHELESAAQALREREERLRLVLEGSADGFWDWNMQTGEIFYSPHWAEIHGFSPEDIEPSPHMREKLIHPDDLSTMKLALNAQLDGTTPKYEAEYRILTKTGEWKWILDSGRIVARDEQGKPLRMAGTVCDITKRKQADQELRKSEEKYRSIFENATEGIFQTTLQGRFMSINPAFAKMHGFNSAEEMISTITNITHEYYINPDDRMKLIKHLVDQGKFNNFETDVYCKNGKMIRVLLNVHKVSDQNGEIQYLEGTCVDITERKKAEERLKYLSHRDSLTGLYNRYYYETEMQRLEELGGIPVGIIMGDINGLKLVNDTLGHKVGDNILVATAKALKDCFRDDDLVARVGGDEFSIILPFVNKRRLEDAAERIRTEIKNYNIDNIELPLSISIGFAYKKQDDLISIYDLFKQSENNMYREKLQRSQSARSAIVNTLIKTMEARDYDTEKHAERLIALITAFASKIHLTESELSDLVLFAQFHDIGKVGIADSILLKPGPLTQEERKQMQSHTEIGHRIAQASPDLILIADLIRNHHEWWNGKGYPLGLKEHEIPLECRMLAIVDAYDAMTSDRPYRRAMSHDQAVNELIEGKCTQFDPDLVDKFISLLRSQSLAVT